MTLSPTFRAELKAHLALWSGRDERRAAFELVATAGVYVVALFIASESLRHSMALGGGWWLWGSLSTVVLALAQVRAFLVHHDLCHGSAFRSHRLNASLAVLFGTLVSTSSSVWKREHDRHHRDSNNLDRPQDGQTAPWTVARYRAAPHWQRWVYWALNQPVVLFGVLPVFYFLGFMRVAARWYENLAFGVFVMGLWATGSWLAFIAALLPATVFGFLVFHAQHTGPTLVRRRTADYDFVENGLRGSTWLVWPRVPMVTSVLEWFLYGVEFHHVHHLCPSMPAWRHRACHTSAGALFSSVARIEWLEVLRSTRLVLYDEEAHQLTSFGASLTPWKLSRGTPS